MGNRKALLPVSMALSALSALAGMLPYILIWFIVRELLAPGETIVSGNIETYAWWAAGLAVGSVILYFAALMASHLAAFRVESNLRREAMRKIVQMPLGFFDYNTSGRIRKIIDDNAGITHSFLAHQMPDLAATFLVPLVAAILIFSFDWRLGLACMAPVIISMIVMGFMMGTQGRQFMQSYMTALEEMNTEAVEYVRGIPVVKFSSKPSTRSRTFTKASKTIIKWYSATLECGKSPCHSTPSLSMVSCSFWPLWLYC